MTTNHGRRWWTVLTFVSLILPTSWIVYANTRPTPSTDANFSMPDETALQDGTLQASEGHTKEVAARDQAASPTQREFRVDVVYSPDYLIRLGGLEKMHPFDIAKYQKIHDELLKEKLLSEEQTHKPAALTKEDLLLIHTEDYLERLKSRENIVQYLEADALQFAPFSLESRVLQPFLRASGGTVLASRLALKHGIGINIGGGYHHAKPDTGEGFCLYADIPIAIRKLQAEKLIEKAVIVDVDVHQGNGTILCLDDDPSTFTFSMHQGDIYPRPKEVGDLDVELSAGIGDDEFMETLEEHLATVLDESQADICFIVGGCDTLSGDPLAELEMTLDGIVRRDAAIVAACVERQMPVVLTLAGGYSPEAWKSQYASIAHLITMYQLADDKVEKTPKTFSSMETIAGSGKVGNVQLRSAPLDAAISNPFGIAPDSIGNLVIASFDEHVIYRMSADRKELQWIAGTGKQGQGKGVNVSALEVAMDQPHEIRVDNDDNIFVADTRNNRVGKIDHQGKWTTVVGTGEIGFSGDGGPATEATLNQSYSIVVDGIELFVADLANHRIRRVDLNTGIIDTICGTDSKGRPTDGAKALGQPLDGPRSLAIDPENLWIVLREGNSVWRIDRQAGTIHHVAGTGQKGFTGDGGDAKSCTLNGPKGVAVSPGVALFIADTENHAIRQIDLKSQVITTVAGSPEGKAGFNGDGNDPTTRLLKRPHGVCWLASGELLIGDSENHRIRVLK